MKTHRVFIAVLVMGLLFTACSIIGNSSKDVLRNQTGTLISGAPPAVDGSGILFDVGDTTYGAPGTRDDYADYFPEGENQVLIKADIRLTGEETVRGWGSTYPEIVFLRIERVE